MTKTSLLFVDDNENILQGLRRNLRSMHGEWDMHFAGNGTEALRILQEKPVDVVVSDMRMPGVDGVTLLTEAKTHHPGTIRFILSGQCEEDSLVPLLGVSHQYLAKPFDAAALIAAIKPVLQARQQLADENLKFFITGLAGLPSLPSLPSLHREIMAEIQQAQPSIQIIENLLLRDVSLVAKIFQVLNSSYFGSGRDIHSAAYIWEVLGIERIKKLVLDGVIMMPLPAALEADDPFIGNLWRMSLLTARIARLIAKAENLPPKMCDKVWVAGLLHALGALVFYEHARSCGRAADADCLDPQKTRDPYTRVGGFLSLLWGLPQDVCHVTAYHANPEKAGADVNKTVLAVVHAAWSFAYEKCDLGTRKIQEGYLEQAGFPEAAERWRAVAATI